MGRGADLSLCSHRQGQLLLWLLAAFAANQLCLPARVKAGTEVSSHGGQHQVRITAGSLWAWLVLVLS